MSFNVFISYSTKDIEKIIPHLERFRTIDGVKTFFADESLIPGSKISNEITKAIKECDVFLLFNSSSAKKSNYVQQEIGIAIANNKNIIPIVLDVSKPEAMLMGVNYLDLSDKKKYDAEIKRLHNFIISKVEKKKQDQAVLVLALLILALLMLKD